MRGRVLAAIGSAVLLCGLALAAWTPGPKQTIVLEKIAQVIAGSRVCDQYVLNEKLVAHLQIRLQFRIADPDVFAYLDGRVRFHQDRIAGRTAEDICAAMERLYGPRGTDAIDLALKKN